MKLPFPTMLLFCACILCCQAQSNLPPTNGVVINELGTRLIFFSLKSVATNSNSGIIGDKELLAHQPNYWILHNTNGKGALFPEYNHRFSFELKTTNGIPIPMTEMGRQMSRPPKSLTDDKTGKLWSIWSEYSKVGDFPALEKLFDFPSNGIYVFELRCWSWQPSKKQYVLSDPIRVNVIKQDVKLLKPVLTSQTNSISERTNISTSTP